jgi:adenylosuccinate synthase
MYSQDISRDLAIKILQYLDKNDISELPFLVMCREYTPEDNDFVELSSDEWEVIKEDPIYQTFQLWETGDTFKNCTLETVELLAQGLVNFIDRKSLDPEFKERTENCYRIWEQ